MPELLVQDERFAYPTTYECFAPNHFLVSRRVLPWLVHVSLPKQRPMDNMLAGAHLPQEDEFALGALGCPTPYWRMVFPNEPPCYMELLDREGVEPHVLARWKRDMVSFVRALTYYKRKPVILKSPPHTGRVGVLAELFPGAKFIHITRNPETLYASTRRLWPTLDLAQGLQVPNNEHLDEYIFEAFERMYRGFESSPDRKRGQDGLRSNPYRHSPPDQGHPSVLRAPLGRHRPSVPECPEAPADLQDLQAQAAPAVLACSRSLPFLSAGRTRAGR